MGTMELTREEARRVEKENREYLRSLSDETLGEGEDDKQIILLAMADALASGDTDSAEELRWKLLSESRITEDMPDGYTREGLAYFLEARSGLIKKTITNKRGHKQTVYVRPGDDSTAADKSTQARADSRTAVAMAIGQTSRLTMSQMHRLSDHIGELTRDEIREHLRTLGERIGGEKRKIAERLVERIRAEHGKSEPYVQPRPEPKDPTANAVDSNRERGNNPGVGTRSESPKPEVKTMTPKEQRAAYSKLMKASFDFLQKKVDPLKEKLKDLEKRHMKKVELGGDYSLQSEIDKTKAELEKVTTKWKEMRAEADAANPDSATPQQSSPPPVKPPEKKPGRSQQELLKMSHADLAEIGMIRTSGPNGPYVRRGTQEELNDYL